MCWPASTGSSRPGYLDPKKLVVMGGSYGGYMTMMAVTKAPEVWAAGVPIVPFVNWFTEIENEDPVLREMRSRHHGRPCQEQSALRRSLADFLRRSDQGAAAAAGGRTRSALSQSPKTQQVVDAIKKRGGIVDYKVYENEGHGFARVENQIDAYKRVADFLLAHVVPADCGCSLNE